ncbi:MAG: LPXTG cell wall anchor domain-containing protein [Clostridia bacterium]|nr:LPXTG cell wall anchor domain-containing protein [Clostridia bacterium]
MKKTIKKLVSTVAAIALFTVSAFSAFALDAGKITISNPTAGKTYSAYKLFDASVSDDGTGVTYKMIGEKTSTMNSALFGTGTPFTVSDTTGVVGIADGMKDSDIITFLKGISVNSLGTAKFTYEAKSTDTTVVFDVGTEYGYYYVTSNPGAAVSITSATPTATIMDKSDMPKWNPENPNDTTTENPPLGKLVSDTGDAGSYTTTSHSGIGVTEYFLISAHCPAYAGTNKVKSYYFTDTLGEGFTFNSDSVELYVDGSKVTTLPDGFTSFDETTNVITFTYPVDKSVDLVIKYTATTDKDADYTNLNTAAMDWICVPCNPDGTPSSSEEIDTGSPDYTPTPNDPKFPPTPEDKTTTTYVYDFTLTKLDAANDSQLYGAKFAIFNGNDEIKVIVTKTDDDNNPTEYRVAEATETGADLLAGSVKVFGLDIGSYTIKEVEAPAGYNVAADQTVNIDGENAASVTFRDSKGSTLPSTGGMGTTIFIVAGSVLMVGAFVGIITKKRMDLKEEEK